MKDMLRRYFKKGLEEYFEVLKIFLVLMSLDGRRFYKYLLQSFQEPSLDISQVGS